MNKWIIKMSSKQKRITSDSKEIKENKISSKISSSSNSSSHSSSNTTNTNITIDDDYEKGKKIRSNNNRDELDADRKAVEDLDKWEY